MIKNILIPTDFSETSRNAYRYALGLARQLELEEVDVVNVYTPETAPDVIVIPPMDEILATRRKALEDFVASFDSKIKVNAKLEIGFAADEVIQASKNYDLIILGSTGETGVLERVFGKVSSAVAQKAHCPVLIVPAEANFKNYRTIMYAGNDLSVSKQAVQKFMDFNDLFHARVHFIHVSESDKDRDPLEREKLLGTLFSSIDLDFSFEIGEVKADTITEGLREYSAQHPIDLVVMVTKHRGFWASFFHRSQTKQMVLHPELPILIFHV